MEHQLLGEMVHAFTGPPEVLCYPWPDVLPENLLKKQPTVLHFTLLLRDAGSQGRMEIRQLGHAHI